MLPKELERARVLSDRLHGKILLAKSRKLDKVSFDVEDAEELVQLIADSLATAKKFDLVEYDGSVRPSRQERIGCDGV